MRRKERRKEGQREGGTESNVVNSHRVAEAECGWVCEQESWSGRSKALWREHLA